MAKTKVKIKEDGNIEVAANKTENFITVKSIDELWGVSKKLYKHKTEDEYSNFINELNDNDLYKHCLQYEVSMSSTRQIAINELVRLFRADFKKRNQDKSKNINAISSEMNKKIIKLIKG